MTQLLPYLLLSPIIGLILLPFFDTKRERIISGIAMSVANIQLLFISVFSIVWLLGDRELLYTKLFTVYSSTHFEFFISFLFDPITMTFAWMGALINAVVVVFSKYYMHRDPGFKRFFGKMMLFYTGYLFVVFAGNFETLFIGWECIGIASFLLIGFYRDRYLPMKNSFKVLSFYRLGDMCLVMVMWLSHHLWHKNVSFTDWQVSGFVQSAMEQHHGELMFLITMLFIAAMIKSAQMPFSTWLTRAMEGPTASSAVFYGSLAVHIGVFLLLRTYPLWQHDPVMKYSLIILGILSAIVTSLVASVQSTVKTQIAYSSIAQIGLIFVEIALGWHILALIHFSGNALLRTYQLLVSPSVLHYKIHEMFYHFSAKKPLARLGMMAKWHNSIYLLSVKEWNTDYLLNKYLWQPFKYVGRALRFFDGMKIVPFSVVLCCLGILSLIFRENIHDGIKITLSHVFLFLSLFLVLRSFSERKDARNAWILVLTSQVFTALAIFINKHFEFHQILLYLSGSLIAGAVGIVCLNRLKEREGDLHLHSHRGHSHEHRGIAVVFLVACLGMSGFPITPSFLGTDILFTHVHLDQVLLISLMALNFVFVELSLIRIYIRLFTGPHKKQYHPIAFKSS